MGTSTNGDRCDAWYDGSAVCVVAVGAHGDPLDLGEDEVVELIEKLQACLKQARGGDEEQQEEKLDGEARKIQELIVGKAVSGVFRPRINEVVLQFSDGTRFLVDTKSIPEFSVT